MSNWPPFNLQNATSPIMEQLIFFHDHAMLIILIINTMILYTIMILLKNKKNNKFILHNQFIEIIWTIIPMLILIFMAIPSLKILYLADEILQPAITIKCLGNQWYWKYEYSDFNELEFDSYMIPEYSNNSFRLLDVDNRVIVPCLEFIRFLITSVDVIHSWTVPSMGVKIDAVPGRINQVMMIIFRPGLHFGQCSEICGMYHSFMPIVIESTTEDMFIIWLKLMK